MARQKGSANFAGTLEVLAGGPLDARSQVPTKADLTVASNFPYPYVGMQVYVIAEGKRYTLKAADVTVLANWEVEGSGGTGGGHTIEDNEGTALTQRDTLQFGGDLEVSDDDENEKTVVSPHELTAAELAEIVTPLPSVPVNMPILFDESGAEYQVGWYKYANGTKKPVYEKTIMGLNIIIPENLWATITSEPDNIEKILYSIFHSDSGLNGASLILYPDDVTINESGIGIRAEFNSNIAGRHIIGTTFQYTKTTDTPS